MKRRLLSALCLTLVTLPLNSIAISQTPASKKRAIETVPPVIAVDGTRDISEIEAYSTWLSNGVALKWTTLRETDVVGFNVYRIDKGGERFQVNESLIAGAMFTRNVTKFPETSGSIYTHHDPAGTIGSQYVIETVKLDGSKKTQGPVSPTRAENLSATLGYEPQFQNRGSAAPAQSNQRDFSIPVFQSAGSRMTQDPAAQKWIASQPGVKINVRNNGMYRVTKAQLEAAGFNVNAPYENWQLYVDGIQVKMHVAKGGNYIEFFGTGIDIPYTDSRVYYLLNGPTAGARMSEVFRRPFAPNIQGQYFQSTTVFERRTNFVYQITNGDEDNWWGAIMAQSQPLSQDIELKDVNQAYPYAEVEVAVQGFLNGLHRISVRLNGNNLGEMQYDGIQPYAQTFTVPTSMLVEGANNFQFACLNGGSDISLMKSIKINYARSFKAVQNNLAFTSVNNHATKVTGFDSSNVRVFTVSKGGEPQLIINTTTTPGTNGGFDVNVPSGRSSAMIAVADSALLAPVSITANTPSTLSDGTSNAHMVILTHSNFAAGANAWATYRRADNLNVDIVNVEDIYDEFDFGRPTPEAVRSYLQYADTNYPNLKYAFLIGDSSYDPRNYLNRGYNDFIPSRFVNTSVGGESPSDEWLADFDGDSVAELAIGRLPIRSNDLVTLLLNKITVFEANITNDLAERGVLFVADEPNTYPFPDVNRLLAAELPPGTPIEYIDRTEDPNVAVVRARLISEINEGKFVVNYTGHGSPAIWSSSQMFRIVDVPLLTNAGDKQSMFFMLTCLNGFFVDPQTDWLAETLLKAPNGGAPIVWASTGSTTPDIQQIMATRFFTLMGTGTHLRLGDAIKEAKLDAPNPDIPLTWALFGDPASHMK